MSFAWYRRIVEVLSVVFSLCFIHRRVLYNGRMLEQSGRQFAGVSFHGSHNEKHTRFCTLVRFKGIYIHILGTYQDTVDAVVKRGERETKRVSTWEKDRARDWYRLREKRMEILWCISGSIQRAGAGAAASRSTRGYWNAQEGPESRVERPPNAIARRYRAREARGATKRKLFDVW